MDSGIQFSMCDEVNGRDNAEQWKECFLFALEVFDYCLLLILHERPSPLGKLDCPEVKIKINQIKKINNVCPMSGCIANNKAINKVIKNENAYFK